MSKLLLGLIGLGLLTGGVSGCHRCWERPTPPVRPGSSVVVPAPLPPPSVPAAPPPGNFGPLPTAPPTPAAPAIPPTGAVRNYSPEDAVPTVRLSPPEPATSAEPPVARSRDERQASPALPVDIPQFAYAQEGKVAVGLQPYQDGFRWLRVNGFRTVLHLKAPGTEDAADRRLIEGYGMKYQALDVSPLTLNRQTVEAFAQVIGNPNGQPVFVYDRDGILAGGLWYLHFRLNEKLDDGTARSRVSRLGLKVTSDSADKAMWLAIQKLLSSV